jgi:DNA repair exonuclease SbcCD ATPase subunit
MKSARNITSAPFQLNWPCPQFFLEADTGANATVGTNAAAATGQTPTSQTANTSASDGVNTGSPAEGAATAAATAGESNTIDNANAETKPEQGKDNSEKPKGFKAPQSQKELDEMVKQRLETVRAQEQAKAKREKLEAEGNWQQVAEGLKTQIADLEKQLADAQSEIQKRDEAAEAAKKAATRQQLVKKVAEKHKLPDKIAELLRGETEAQLEAHAKELAGVVGTPKAPPTEGGTQAATSAARAQEAKKNYSFNQAGGVEW